MALSTTTTTPTGWAADAAYKNYQAAQGIAGKPYTPYTGNMLAGFNPTQLAGMTALATWHQYGGDAMAQAQAAAQGAAGFQGQQVNAGGYQAAQIANPHYQQWASAGPAAQATAAQAQLAQMQAAQMGRGEVRNVAAGQFPGANLGAYMNPYTSSVIDTTLSTLGRQNDVLQNQANAKAAAAGAFGGSRQAVMNAENNRNFMDTAASTTASLNNQNFAQAQAAIAADQNRALQASGMNQQMDFNVGNLNTSNRQQAGLQNMLASNQTSQYNASNRQATSQYNAGAQNQMAQYDASNRQSAWANDASAANTILAQNMAAQNRAGEFSADLGLRAQLANQSAAQNAANTRLSGANALNGMGLDQQQWHTNNATGAVQAGAMAQRQNQAELTQQYDRWLEAQGYDRAQLGYLQSSLGGYNSGSANSSPYYANTAANVLAGGLGVGALAANAGNIVNGASAGYNALSGLFGGGGISGYTNVPSAIADSSNLAFDFAGGIW